MKTIIKWVVIVFIALIILGLIFGGTDETTTTADADVVTSSESTSTELDEVNETSAENTEATTEVEDDTVPMTAQQKNAVRSAKQYTSLMGFSRDGLINQLSSTAGDGYSVEDATVAVDSLDIDWKEQAAKSAKNYLDMQGFSCDGLVKQLSSSAGDKYTKEQADYGAKVAGACD